MPQFLPEILSPLSSPWDQKDQSLLTQMPQFLPEILFDLDIQ
jgi:hypothetical protein